MRQKRDVIEYELKKQMLSKCLLYIKPYILNNLKNKRQSDIIYKITKDLLKHIDLFNIDNKIEYPFAFYFCIIMGMEYSKIISNKEILEETQKEMLNEKNWDNSSLSLNLSIFFSYTFFNELYKDISIDIYMIEKSNDTKKTLNSILKDIIK